MSGTRKSNLLGKFTILFVICCFCLPAQAKYGGGTGAPNDPYLIYTPGQMNAIGADPCDWDKHFLLCADIDLGQFTAEQFNIIGTDWDHLFTGAFDGDGHTISNFTYTSTGTNHIAIFGYVDCAGVVIKDLGLANPNIDAGNMGYVGSLIGYLKNGTISNCYVQGGSLAGRYCVGGLVGFIWYGTITNCYSSGDVSGDGGIGGLVGYNYGTITNSYATGSVEADGHSGGLVGRNDGASGAGIISDCYARGNVSVLHDDAGGLVGRNNTGTVTNCYSTGSVSGDRYIGGLVGENYKGTIANCYSTGSVSGDLYIGGLVGENYKGTVIASFWDFQTSGLQTSDGGTGKTTTEMQMANTFIAWSCDPVWTIDDNDYPKLVWENAPGEPITTPSYGGGSGELNDPYLIYTADQLNTIGLVMCHWEKHFKLMADIDLGGFHGTAFNIIGTADNPFTGVFDGSDHTISNFTYTSTDTDYIGLFGYVDGPNAEIKDLGLINSSVDAGTGGGVGSLVGWLINGTITACYAEVVSVSGRYWVGGLVGRNGGTITNCYSTASVSGTGWDAGGLVGQNDATISNCYSTASVSGNKYVGGLLGENCGTITDCYSEGVVSGTTNVGGLAGRNYYGIISNSYSTGDVSGTTNVGGLMGANYGDVICSFWDTQTSGQATSAAGTGLPTDQMQMASTFIAWTCCDCAPVWTIDEQNDYPRLCWENAPGEPITTPSYGGGSGESNDPYLIYTAEQLNTIGLVPCHLDKHFKLMADIDLSAYTGTSFNIIGYYVGSWQDDKPFRGVFDGNGHTISNFSYTSTDSNCIGLFGYVNGTIKDLGLLDPDVDAGEGCFVGSLAGWFRYGTITNCYVDGASVAGTEGVGGLVGQNGLCYHAGECGGGTISNCYSTGIVSGYSAVGGIIGKSNGGTISNCYSDSVVLGTSYVGGLLGLNDEGTISNSYSNSDVSGEEFVGGLVGTNSYMSRVSNSYSSGSVSADYDAGGLTGAGSGQVSICFWDIERSGQTTSAGGIGKTTTEMQKTSTFFAWACDPVWTIDDGTDYPRLVWENKPGELITIPSDLYGGGTGEPDDPYLIYTAEQLNKIALFPCDLDKHFKLMADIDLGQFDGKEGREKFNIIGRPNYGTRWVEHPFTGVFDGSGYTISNFTYDSYDTDYIGLFGVVHKNNAAIKDLGLIDPNVDAEMGRFVGSLVGMLYDATITNCYVKDGTVAGSTSVGGLLGYNSWGTINNCSSTGSIEGGIYVGGLSGYNRGTITNCSSTASVSGDENVGGLDGYNKGTITNCYSTGSISGDVKVGGLAGYSKGTITNCYSTGSAVGEWDVGGLVGLNYNTIIIGCYSTGSVSGGERVGGLVGLNDGEVMASFWDIETSGQTTSDGGTGLPTAEMQMASTFTDAGWDFVGETFNGIEDIWFIPQQDYPHLWWEGMGVSMKLTPRTLKCRSEGNWVKAHITLPQGFTVADVDPNRPAVLHSFGFQSLPLHVSVNKNKLVQVEAAFERQVFCSLVGNWPDALTVAGFLADGNIFLGTSKVRIIHPGMNVIEELASYWLQTDCVHPDFCNRIDMNRDSLVNLADYALLMNINVEFVSDNENYPFAVSP